MEATEPIETTDHDWSEVDQETVQTIVEHGDRHLRAQLDVGTSADQRAVTAAAIFSASSIAVLAPTLLSFSRQVDGGIQAAGLVVAACFFFASLGCMRAGRPTDFYSPGSQPENWFPVKSEPLNKLLGGQAENIQLMIEHNDKILVTNAKWLTNSVRLASLSPIIGFVFWWVC